MTRQFTNGHPQRLPACNFLSQYLFYNIFLLKYYRFSLRWIFAFDRCVGLGTLVKRRFETKIRQHVFKPRQIFCLFRTLELCISVAVYSKKLIRVPRKRRKFCSPSAFHYNLRLAKHYESRVCKTSLVPLAPVIKWILSNLVPCWTYLAGSLRVCMMLIQLKF